MFRDRDEIEMMTLWLLFEVRFISDMSGVSVALNSTSAELIRGHITASQVHDLAAVGRISTGAEA